MPHCHYFRDSSNKLLHRHLHMCNAAHLVMIETLELVRFNIFEYLTIFQSRSIVRYLNNCTPNSLILLEQLKLHSFS